MLGLAATQGFLGIWKYLDSLAISMILAVWSKFNLRTTMSIGMLPMIETGGVLVGYAYYWYPSSTLVTETDLAIETLD